jgi:transcriptional regulator with GAF, ATPase, and Fis domain
VTWASGCLAIGRHPANHVALVVDGASRWHAALFEEASRTWRVRNLGSRHGVRVDGRRVSSRLLEDGDAFELGPCRLTFAAEEGGGAGGVAALVDDGRAAEGVTTLEAPEGSGALSLLALFEAVQAVAARRDVDEILDCLLDQVSVLASPSDSVAALVRRDGTLDPRSVRAASAGAAAGPVPMSRTLVQRAVESGRSVVASDLGRRPELASASVSALGLTAAACLPLVAGGRVRGLVHAQWRADRPAPSAAALDALAALALHAGTALENGLHVRALREERDRLASLAGMGTQLVGVSRALRELADVADRCAAADVDVLLTGETGTGKELVARRIHERSRRRAGPFVAVNCAAIPPDLFESELFGHVRGAFTHALAARAGRFADAHGGTLFLDEVGETSPAHQAKLLRVLEDRTVTPVGGRPQAVDLRVVAATNRDVEAAVRGGALRADLRQRLGVPIAVAPLRERPEDVPVLAYWLIDRLAAAQGRASADISAVVLERLVEHSWPGNVRELAACLRNALLFCGDTVEPSDLRLSPAVMAKGEPALKGLDEVEREHLLLVLRATGGNQARAARILGINENTVKAKMERHGIARENLGG